MRVTIERDGRSETVEVAPGGDSVTVGAERYPVTVVRSTAMTVELEIAGEKVIVDNWPDHFPEPPIPVDVNGERWAVRISRGPEPSGPAPAAKAVAPRPELPSTAPVGAPPAAPGGTPVLPPMPGKVIEIRVKDGDRVRKGDILLVLEAMKMRNEIASPADGVVRGLRVGPGSNARAREPMVYVTSE
jgi:glutaconyl-CoA/methylmalonyl-CoA decarboxylase subunit gamma